MKKRGFLTLMTVMMTYCMVVAQVTPIVLGDRHVMLKMETQHAGESGSEMQGSRYLLLPVQETEDIAAISVLDNRNNMVQRINVKLAIDRVDYYMPYELNGACLMDIEFHGDRRQKGAVSEFVCWKEMKYSETFDMANSERFRPAYHHTPCYGWMNDPNGMFYKDGTYHLYFQYNPYGSQWENMTWGHSTSNDLVHWTPQPNAIEPDALGSIFSGSCVVDKNNTAGFGQGTVVAFYTSAGANQTQSMAYSTDGGKTFTKYAGNPILTADIPDFRDPKVFWHEATSRWILILAAGQEMRLYSSENLKNWKYESSFGQEYGNHSGVWECPDLIPFGGSKDEKWMLVCNINPGGPFGGSATQYFIGNFDGHRFTCESSPKTTKWMDYGKDHYATVTFSNAPDNRKIALAWMSNWQYASQVPTKQFRSANSIPRDLGLFTFNNETYCSVVPSKEMLAMRGKKLAKPSATCEIVVDMKASAEIVLSNDKGEQVTMVYNAPDNTFSMDRTMSGDCSFSDAFSAKTIAPTYGKISQLRIFVDTSSIEAFDAEGKMAMTNLVFPSEPYSHIKVKGGKATIYEMKNQ